jgi:hypothetical protein
MYRERQKIRKKRENRNGHAEELKSQTGGVGRKGVELWRMLGASRNLLLPALR